MKTCLFSFLILFSCFCSGKAQNNNKLLKPERVYLHTDRNVYIAGGYLFYTMYLQGDTAKMSRYAYLILRDRHNSIITHDRLEIINRVAFGSVYLPDTLSTAIYQIVCYTNCMRNEGEGAYFKKEIVIVNRFDEKMDLFTDPVVTVASDTSSARHPGIIDKHENIIVHFNKLVFDQREKISFSVESNILPDDSIVRLSVSISEITPGIPDELSISEYFSNKYQRSFTGELYQNHCSFIPEINWPAMQGKVLPEAQSGKGTDSVKTNSMKNYTVLVSTIDSIVNMQFTKTDSLGSFGFLLNPYYDGKELVVKLKENVNATIVLDNKFNLKNPFSPSDAFNVSGIKAALIRSRNIAQVQKFYNKQTVTDIKKEFLPAKTIPRVYYKQYAVIIPSDFLELKDFVEIAREIVPALKVRKIDAKFVSGYLILQDQAHMNVEPAIFLDGIPIDDVNQIITLGTSKIKRIESLPATRYYGEMSFSGILAVFTKDLEINSIQFKTPTIKYTALSSQSYTEPEFFKPVDTSKNIPDLRQLLLWEPEIILKNNEKRAVECFASDIQGKYLINIQGITSGGNPVTGSATITIQNKSK